MHVWLTHQTELLGSSGHQQAQCAVRTALSSSCSTACPMVLCTSPIVSNPITPTAHSGVLHCRNWAGMVWFSKKESSPVEQSLSVSAHLVIAKGHLYLLV